MANRGQRFLGVLQIRRVLPPARHLLPREAMDPDPSRWRWAKLWNPPRRLRRDLNRKEISGIPKERNDDGDA